jgi:hypothetical protein
MPMIVQVLSIFDATRNTYVQDVYAGGLENVASKAISRMVEYSALAPFG